MLLIDLVLFAVALILATRKSRAELLADEIAALELQTDILLKDIRHELGRAPNAAS